jgi:hypothetical protein
MSDSSLFAEHRSKAASSNKKQVDFSNSLEGEGHPFSREIDPSLMF